MRIVMSKARFVPARPAGRTSRDHPAALDDVQRVVGEKNARAAEHIIRSEN
jgi:hypothetical protein